jgi:hypothetical protein
MYMESVILDARTAYGGGNSCFYGQPNGEGDVGEKAADKRPPHEEWSAKA